MATVGQLSESYVVFTILSSGTESTVRWNGFVTLFGLVRFSLEPLNIHTETRCIIQLIKYVQTAICVGGENKWQWRCCHGAGVPEHPVPCFCSFLPSLALIRLTWAPEPAAAYQQFKKLAVASTLQPDTVWLYSVQIIYVSSFIHLIAGWLTNLMRSFKK